MKKIEKFKKRVNNYLFDHYILKNILDYIKTFIFAAFGAFLFAVGFCLFVTTYEDGFTVVTGGASGLSQVLTLLAEILFGIKNDNNTVYSIFYFAVNIPLLLFAFFKISKKFGVFSLICVLMVSGFIRVFSPLDFTQSIINSDFFKDDGNVLSRVIFAAICTGGSSAICFKADISCGGIDIITYYIGMKKSSTIGKYTFLINVFVIISYSAAKICQKPEDASDCVFIIFYSIMYLLVCGLVIDYINSRNKKVQIQLITNSPKMQNILLAYFPHGATTTHGTGAYTHEDRIIIWMVVSANEVHKVIKVAKKVDEHVFISTIPLQQVYGKFYNKPIE